MLLVAALIQTAGIGGCLVATRFIDSHRLGEISLRVVVAGMVLVAIAAGIGALGWVIDLAQRFAG